MGTRGGKASGTGVGAGLVFWLIIGCVAAARSSADAQDLQVPALLPAVETASVEARGDAADDAAVWRHSSDLSRSLILATDKKRGLMVYDLTGRIVQTLPVGRLNNVDLRRVGGGAVAVGSNRSDQSLTVFWVEDGEDAGQVREIGRIPTGMAEPYGLCLHREPETGALFAYVPDKTGAVPVFRLSISMGSDGPAHVEGERIHDYQLSTQAEGCVVDDAAGHLYVGEENVGIWQLPARPGAAPDKAIQLAAIGAQDGLAADVEGLALLPDREGRAGHLVASSQGDSTFAVFDLSVQRLVARFRIGANRQAGIDAVTETDGIEIAFGDFGDAFASGLFIAQDDSNEEGEGSKTETAPQNFKLVPLDAVFGLIK